MTTDHDAAACTYQWCLAPGHQPQCDCAYSEQYPHPARGCRYRRDDQDHDDGDNQGGAS
jgi:hypothetical protein